MLHNNHSLVGFFADLFCPLRLWYQAKRGKVPVKSLRKIRKLYETLRMICRSSMLPSALLFRTGAGKLCLESKRKGDPDMAGKEKRIYVADDDDNIRQII